MTDRWMGKPPWKTHSNALKFGSMADLLQLQTLNTGFVSPAPEGREHPSPHFPLEPGRPERRARLAPLSFPQTGGSHLLPKVTPHQRSPIGGKNSHSTESFLVTTTSLSRVFLLLPRPLASADHTMNFRKYGDYWARLP